ncbi:MAG: hypothetical protein C4334_07135 [Pyrinomonas sp.]
MTASVRFARFARFESLGFRWLLLIALICLARASSLSVSAGRFVARVNSGLKLPKKIALEQTADCSFQTSSRLIPQAYVRFTRSTPQCVRVILTHSLSFIR